MPAESTTTPSTGPDTPVSAKPLVRIALAGNPNSGKTSLFNALTGLRHKVANYPGVTVERKSGLTRLPNGLLGEVLDLPGLYSLAPDSPDETVAREVLEGRRTETLRPDVVVNVLDCTSLERNLYLTCQLIEMGVPIVVALTMTDTAAADQLPVRADLLEAEIGLPVVPVDARRGRGINALLNAIYVAVTDPPRPGPCPLPQNICEGMMPVVQAIEANYGIGSGGALAEALSLLASPPDSPQLREAPAPVRAALEDVEARFREDGRDLTSEIVDHRYRWASEICGKACPGSEVSSRPSIQRTDRIDRWALHPVAGYLLFALVMTALFQAVFSLAEAPMGWIEAGVGAIGHAASNLIPPGDIQDLLVSGILGGVGNTLVFLPQILLLFFFISLLEDTGYMVRAAFLADRLMSRVGLHGRSFLPLLSSFGCAIPGVMAARTIGDPKARLITMLVAPLMSCSARLPVYALLIGAFVPAKPVLSAGGIVLLTLPGATLIAMYLLGAATAFGVAWLFHRTLLRGETPAFLLEMPPYRSPNLKSALLNTWDRGLLFARRAGTIILSITVVLWFFSTYPKRPDLPETERMAHSFAGQAGRIIEPLIAPLGFDWKTGVAILASFAAREVFVSSMGTLYSVQDAESDEGATSLRQRLRSDTNPRTGQKVFTPLVAVSLMVYYVLAMQCMSTVAVMRRETNGWKWPLFQLVYMTAIAWIASFAVYQGGCWLGWG